MTERKDLREEEEKGGQEQELPPLKTGEIIPKIDETVKRNQTKPPPAYTSASLIKKMSQLGLGTQATRANYETTLLKRGYIVEKKGLHVTAFGRTIIEAGVGNLQFADPEFTAKQEKYLDDIARGKRDYRKAKRLFLSRIQDIARETVEQILNMRVKKSDIDDAKKKDSSAGKCSCGGEVIEMKRVYKCKKCGKYVFKTVAGKRLTRKQLLSLMQGKEVVAKGFKSKKGKRFSATLLLVREGEKWTIKMQF